AVEDRARGHRCPSLTLTAHPQPGPGAPELEPPARRADEALRPAQLCQVVQTRLVVREPLQQLLVGRRIVHATNRTHAHRHILLQLSGYADHVSVVLPNRTPGRFAWPPCRR